MKDADVASSSDEEEDQTAADSSHTEKSGRIPPQLRNFHDPLAASRFEEYYLNLVTQEFGDDLYSIRDAKDFDPARSMPMLVRALKQGVNIFDPDEKRMLISSLSKGEGE
ncbi:hypothetical protein EX30DRAFT_337731 [Ascodesmis nigricans]|uniref:Ribosome assembly protein 3 n=1 Tax=Ascodesmis nigricans TaxID=341454 RepID=A0A4V3SJU7_9PEZI|nr:hypothetical protein EX30DRAFT_337731 [Ascodesmis nigricans]